MLTFDRLLLGRYHGALLGLAAGDALGTTLEFKRRGSFTPIDDIVGGGPFGLAAGQWTDDTSMAMCLAESLVARLAFDPHDQMTRYVRWYREGYWSSTGACFDGSFVSTKCISAARVSRSAKGSAAFELQRRPERIAGGQPEERALIAREECGITRQHCGCSVTDFSLDATHDAREFFDERPATGLAVRLHQRLVIPEHI